MRVCTYIYIYIYTQTYIYIYIHTHTWQPSPARAWHMRQQAWAERRLPSKLSIESYWLTSMLVLAEHKLHWTSWYHEWDVDNQNDRTSLTNCVQNKKGYISIVVLLEREILYTTTSWKWFWRLRLYQNWYKSFYTPPPLGGGGV